MTPFEWAGLFAHCDYVLTERFHDTVFAMRYKIPVLTVDWRLRIMNDKMESKRLSILKDFDCTENHSVIRTESELPLIVEKLSTFKDGYKEKVTVKVNEMIERANYLADRLVPLLE